MSWTQVAATKLNILHNMVGTIYAYYDLSSLGTGGASQYGIACIPSKVAGWVAAQPTPLT